MTSQVLATNEVLGARMLAANEVGDVNGGGDRLNNGLKYVEPKTRRSESQKTSKSQKLAKSQKLSKSGKSKGKKSKKLSKSGNSPNFDAKNSGPSFLTPKAKSAFNYLRLAFTKTPIFRHFDPKCHIWIKINLLGYAIGGVLS